MEDSVSVSVEALKSDLVDIHGLFRVRRRNFRLLIDALKNPLLLYSFVIYIVATTPLHYFPSSLTRHAPHLLLSLYLHSLGKPHVSSPPSSTSASFL